MLDIPLFVLVLQIGLNTAFNTRDLYRNPSSHSLHSRYTRQTRREDANLYQPPPSHSYGSNSDYTNYEEHNLKVLPARRYKRRHNYVPDEETAFETTLSRPRPNSYVERSIPLPVVRRRYQDRVPYLQQRLPSHNQPLRRNSYSRLKDYLSSLDASSLKVVDQHKDDDNLMRSLVSLMSELGNKDKTRKYDREDDSFSLEEESDEISESEEATDVSLESSRLNNLRTNYDQQQKPSYKRHNYRKGYNNNNRYDLQIQRTSPTKDISDEIDAILVTDDSKPFEVITIARPIKPDSITNKSNNKDSDIEDSSKYRKKFKDNDSNNLSFYRSLKHLLKKNNQFAKGKKSTKNIPDFLLNAKLLHDNTDSTDQFTALRLSNLGESIDSLPLVRGNKQSNTNFIKFMLVPSNKLTLASEVDSNLTDPLLRALENINLKPLNLDDTDTLSKPKLRSVVDTSHVNSQLESYDAAGPETHGFSQNVHLRSYDDISLVKRLLADKAENNLVPYHESKDHSIRNKEIHSNKELSFEKDDVSGVASSRPYTLNIDLPILEKRYSSGLRTKIDKEELTKNIFNILNLAFPSNDQLSKIKSNIVNKTTSEISRKPMNIDLRTRISHTDQQASNVVDSTNLLQYLEYPWNGEISSDNEIKKPLRTEIPQQHTDELQLEYPWNGELSPGDGNKNNYLRTKKKHGYTIELQLEYPLIGEQSSDDENLNDVLRTQNLITDKQRTENVDSTDTLHLEYPWNGQLVPDDEHRDNTLRTLESEKNTDELYLEYPWNGQLSPDDEHVKTNLRTQKSQTDKQASNAVDFTNELHLDFPWNGEVSPDTENVNNLLRTQHLEDSTDLYHHLEYPWNNQLSPENENLYNTLRSQTLPTDEQIAGDSTNLIQYLKYPWNDELSPDNEIKKPLRTGIPQQHTGDELHLEYPRDGQLRRNDNENNYLRSKKKHGYTIELQLEYPLIGEQSSDDKNVNDALRSHKLLTEKQRTDDVDSTDTLHLEYPWNGQLAPDDENKNVGLRRHNLEDSTDELHLELPWNDKLSPDNDETARNNLRTENFDDITDVLHLEYPWNGQLSPDNINNSPLRSQKSEDYTDELHLEFPWNDKLSPDDDENARNNLRTENFDDYTDVLHLEYPWNGQLSPDNINNSPLRSQKTENYTDELHLEFPWNDKLSPDDDENIKNNLRTENFDDFTDVLHLEFPWNDQLGPDEGNVKNNIQTENFDDFTNVLHLEYPWNGQPSPGNGNNSPLRSQKSEVSDDELHLEFPWNDQLNPDDENVKNNLRTENFDDFTDVLQLEYPWNGQPSPDNINNSALRSQKSNDQSSPDDKKSKLRSRSKSSKRKDLKNSNMILAYPTNDRNQDNENVGKEIVTDSDSTNIETYLRNSFEHPKHRSKYNDETDDSKTNHELSKAVKDLENKYNELKKLVLELPLKATIDSIIKKNVDQKPIARTDYQVILPDLYSQFVYPEYFHRRVHDVLLDNSEKRRHGDQLDYIPIVKRDIDKNVLKYRKSNDDEVSSDSITLPLDRRPVARLAAHQDIVYADRRSNLLLESIDMTTESPWNTTNDIESE